MREVLMSGRWGTVAPKSIEAAEAISKYMDREYALCIHSDFAALEALLRSLNIGYGDQVIVCSYSNPIDSMATSCVGAEPVFCDIDPRSCTLSIDSVKRCITQKTKAVIVDSYAGDCGNLKTLSKLCDEKNVFLIENLGDELVINKYSTATVIDMGSKSSLDLGMGAALVTDIEDVYKAFFAYHNCGRVPGTSDNLKVEDFVGGNMRIAEWQSCLVEPNLNKYELKTKETKKKAKKLESKFFTLIRAFNDRAVFAYNKDMNNGVSKDEYVEKLNNEGIKACNRYGAMHKEPFFESNYFKKITGCSKIKTDDLKGTEIATDTFIWVYWD